MSSNPAHGEVYPIQLYVVEFVFDMRWDVSFLMSTRFYPPIQLTATI